MMRCGSCGSTNIVHGDIEFCPNCGGPNIVTEKIQGFHPRRGCLDCGLWFSKSRLDGTPVVGTEKRSCNRHSDCDVAEKKYADEHGEKMPFNQHCHDEDCPGCFGQ